MRKASLHVPPHTPSRLPGASATPSPRRASSAWLLSALVLGVWLGGCGTQPAVKTSDRAEGKDGKAAVVAPPYTGAGYYKDDGPGANPPDNLASLPDAVPRYEPLHPYANNTYRVLGKTYKPMKSNDGYRAEGLASWYGRKFHGKPTSSGEPYDMYGMTAAHTTLPIPSYARVTNPANGKSVVVRINDRGPFHEGRIIDLSYAAAFKLETLKGVTPVVVEALRVDGEAAPGSFAAKLQGEDPTVGGGVLVAAPDASAKGAPAKDAPAQADAAPKAGANTAPLAVAPVAVSPIAEPSPAQAAAPAGVIYLQLGAFSSQARANELMQRATPLLSRDFPGVLRMASEGLYKVQAGPFGEQAQADQAAALLRDSLGLKPYRIAAPAQASAAAPVSAPRRGLYLQVGALSSETAAKALGERIKSRYGGALPGVARIQAAGLHKLQTGPFADADAASRFSTALYEDFGIRPYKVVY